MKLGRNTYILSIVVYFSIARCILPEDLVALFLSHLVFDHTRPYLKIAKYLLKG